MSSPTTAPAATRRTRVRARRRRHGRRRRDHDLARREVPEQRGGPAGVELGQHVVEHQHRRRSRRARRPAGGPPGAAPAPACAARPARRGCAPAARRSSGRARRGADRPSRRRGGRRPRAPRPAPRPGPSAATAGRSPARPRVGRAGQLRRRPRRRSGRRRSTSVARAWPKRSPTSASLASHTSSVVAAASSRRPPAWLQQRVALAHDAVELEPQRVVLHGQRDQRVVEEPPPIRRAALDQRQVVGREHRHPDHAEQVAGPAQALAVDLHPVAAGRHELGLDQRRPPVVVDAPRRGRPPRVGTDADQRLGRRAAEAGQRGQVGQAPRRGSSCPARCHRRRRWCPASSGTTPSRSCGSRRARGVRRSRSPGRCGAQGTRTGISRYR